MIQCDQCNINNKNKKIKRYLKGRRVLSDSGLLFFIYNSLLSAKQMVGYLVQKQ
jgi:hypothetical protein